MRDIGISLYAASGLSAKEAAKTIKSVGFTKILLDSTTPEKMKDTAEAVLNAGLTFDQLHAPFNTINNMWLDNAAAEDTYRDLTDSIDCCVAFGAPTVVIHLSSGGNPPTITDIGRARYTRLVEYAAQRNINIAFENQKYIYNIAWALHDFKKADNVGFCWDTGHQLCATPDIEFMTLFGDKLICTHLEDNNAVFWEDLHILPFDGKFDFNRGVELMKRYNYQGCLTLEVWQNPAFYKDYTPEAFLKRAFDAANRIRTMMDGE
ncbi:MAG: sugar phosphate isomerase/epimerase [Ruminococcaceae bacterium]|nr:sugar phosphate isomerase/epimerase [Oscillospiraceae bacterium]